MNSWQERVSEDTVIMIEKLKDMNHEFNKLDNIQAKYFNKSIVSVILLFVYLLFFLWFQSEKELLLIIDNLLSKIIHLVLLCIPAYFYVKQLHSQSKVRERKQQLEKLRLEVIDHLKNTWFKNEHSSTRDAISKYMEGFNINVRHKNIT